jgi:hypothetical protein
MHDSAASRREVANACLDLFLLFENCEVVVCAKRSLASLHETHPSCPDLIRASINLREKILSKKDGSPGQAWSSPVTTISVGMTGLRSSQ